jgi:hypothetical protein
MNCPFSQNENPAGSARGHYFPKNNFQVKPLRRFGARYLGIVTIVSPASAATGPPNAWACNPTRPNHRSIFRP